MSDEGIGLFIGAAIGGITGFLVGFCLFAGDWKAGCKAANPSNELVMVDGAARCVSAERAKELRKP